MKPFLLATLLAGAIAFAALAPGAGAATSCGGGVTVTGSVPCYKARSIVKEFKKTRKRRIQGFKCSGSSSGGRVTEVTCRAPSKRIHWKA